MVSAIVNNSNRGRFGEFIYSCSLKFYDFFQSRDPVLVRKVLGFKRDIAILELDILRLKLLKKYLDFKRAIFLPFSVFANVHTSFQELGRLILILASFLAGFGTLHPQFKPASLSFNFARKPPKHRS